MNKNEPKKRYNKVKMARELAVVRKTGLVNMHDRYTVCDLLFRFGYKTTYRNLVECPLSVYIEVLKMSADY